MASADFSTNITKYLKMYKELTELIEQENNSKISIIEKPVNIYQSNSDFHDTLMEQELTPFSFIEDVYLVEYKNFIMCLIMGNNE